MSGVIHYEGKCREVCTQCRSTIFSGANDFMVMYARCSGKGLICEECKRHEQLALQRRQDEKREVQRRQARKAKKRRSSESSEEESRVVRNVNTTEQDDLKIVFPSKETQ